MPFPICAPLSSTQKTITGMEAREGGGQAEIPGVRIHPLIEKNVWIWSLVCEIKKNPFQKLRGP